MVKSDDVKEACVKELIKIFGENTNVYKEDVTSPVYPHFFIYQISVNDEETRKNYHLLSYQMEIRYREKADVSLVMDIQKKLDEIGLKLLENFNLLVYNESKVRCKNKSVEKVDKILHFFFECDILAKNEIEDLSPKANSLSIITEVKK